jgi:hypothetical protein
MRKRGFKDAEENGQLLIQFEAVDIDTPLLRIERGNTSLGSTQPIGPKDMPYAAVKMYVQLCGS